MCVDCYQKLTDYTVDESSFYMPVEFFKRPSIVRDLHFAHAENIHSRFFLQHFRPGVVFDCEVTTVSLALFWTLRVETMNRQLADYG